MKTSLCLFAAAALATLATEVQPLQQAGTGVAPVAPSKYPTVTAHGMGDSCFNAGMKQIAELIGTQTNNKGKCIPTGNVLTDTTNGFLMTMDKNVDVFAENIRKDPDLADGFHCVGFSQGNSLCRGYIQKYNDPPVKTFLSVHGTVSGVAGFPNCDPDGLLGAVCKQLSHLVGDITYTKATQGLLFQIDYFRDPMRVGTDAYKTNSQLAQWNNEGNTVNQTYKENFGKTLRYAMIKAEKDSMVFPNEGEWWGHYADNDLKTLLTMKETNWYLNDTFGLKTADEAGKIFFNSTTGDHLQFSEEELSWWVHNYFVDE
jgi:palmitoyl-protein thioesterase